MYFDQIGAIGRDRLRLLFGGSVVSRDIAGAATYGDVARMFDETLRMRHGNPIAINVTQDGRVPPASRRGMAADGAPTTPE